MYTTQVWNTYFIMRILLLCIVSLGFILKTAAQEGTVTIKQDPKIEQLVEVYKEVNNSSGYYQIQVGFTSTDGAAQRLLDQVEIDFPRWYSTVKFEQPTFRVRLGKFKTKIEAQKRLIEVRKKYPDAFLIPQKISA